MKIKKTAAIATGLACVMAAPFALAACNGETPAKNSVVSLDINPGVEIVLDGKDNVVSVYGTNEDGQVLLYGETDGIVGMTFEKAVDKITKSAVELGFITEQNSVVRYTVSSSITGAENRLNGVIDTRIAAAAGELELGFSIKSDSEVAYSVMRKYEAFVAEHPELKNKLTVKDFSLALSLSENGDVTLEAAVKMDKKELVAAISKASEKTEEYATKAYNAAKAEAERIYDGITAAAIENAYAEYYLKNFTKYPSTAYLGSMYTAYYSTARNLYAIADATDRAAAAAGEVLSSEQTASVLKALGMTEEQLDELRDRDGKITVESVDAYANKLFKNSEASVELDNIKAELTRALNTAESAIKAAAEKINEEYSEEIAKLKDSASSVISALESVSLVLPDSIKTSIAEMRQTIDKIGELVSDGVTVSDVRSLAAEFDKKAQSALERIRSDLPKEALDEIETAKREKEKAFAAAKAEMQSALNKAETAARERLQRIKDELKARAGE